MPVVSGCFVQLIMQVQQAENGQVSDTRKAQNDSIGPFGVFF